MSGCGTTKKSSSESLRLQRIIVRGFRGAGGHVVGTNGILLSLEVGVLHSSSSFFSSTSLNVFELCLLESFGDCRMVEVVMDVMRCGSRDVDIYGLNLN